MSENERLAAIRAAALRAKARRRARKTARATLRALLSADRPTVSTVGANQTPYAALCATRGSVRTLD